jgi:PAS domain S-box-containing protein
MTGQHEDEPKAKQALRNRIRELEDQVEGHADLQGLIRSLSVHQEELRTQQATLHAAQRELEASRDRYAELYDFAPIPILTLAVTGVVDAMNLAAARLLGVDRTHAIGMPFLVYVHADSRRTFLDHMTRCRRGNDMVRSEIVVSSHDQTVPLEIHCKRYETGIGQQVVFQTVLIDQTERRRNEEQRRRISEERERIQREEASARAASEAKDRFLAVLSHELRTPLTPILLTLEALKNREDQSPALRRSLGMIRRNTDVLARLIDDLLDVTRIVHDKLHLTKAPVALHPVLHAVVEMCRSPLEHARLTLDLDLRAQEPWVAGDSLRLRQIFWNLLKNAIQHSPPGTRISLRSEAPSARSVRVEISDSGPGIEAAESERLFEPFQQAEKTPGAGLGLGLAICRGLVEAHGGTIRPVSRAPACGATFVVELPTCSAPEREQALPAPSATPHPLTILLVEDHEDTAAAMQIVLTRLGYAVRLASSLEEGRRMAGEPFDVLVSDLQLPDGSGHDLMRELHARGVKGIAMSGFGSEKDVERSREAGFDLHLVKPVDIHRVVEAIESLAGRRDVAAR